MTNQLKPVYAVYTDDSGVVISQKEYADLHGETQESKRHYFDGWQTHNSAEKKKNKQGKEKLDKVSAVIEVVNSSKKVELMVCSSSKKHRIMKTISGIFSPSLIKLFEFIFVLYENKFGTNCNQEI